MQPDGGTPRPETTPGGPFDHHLDLAPVARRVPLPEPAWWRRPANYVGGAVLLVLLVWLLRPVLTTVGAALAVAYFVSPLVDRLEKRRIPRSISIAAIIGGFFAVLAGVVAILVPVIQHEIESLVRNVPGYWERGNTFFNETLRPEILARTGYELPTTARDFWDQTGTQLQGIAPDVAGRVVEILKSTLSNAFAVLGVVLNLLLFPVFLFYMLQDFPRIRAAAYDAIPPRSRESVMEKIGEVDRVLSAFVRGQITVCIFLAIGYSIGLSISGIDMPVVIGALSGFAFIIPYAGTVLGVVVASVMALAKFGLDWHLGAVIATFAVVQFLESNVISPAIVGKQVGLHPIVMITAVIVGGTLFGFLGILLAVPATAVAAVFWRAGWERYKESEFYLARR